MLLLTKDWLPSDGSSFLFFYTLRYGDHSSYYKNGYLAKKNVLTYEDGKEKKRVEKKMTSLKC